MQEYSTGRGLKSASVSALEVRGHVSAIKASSSVRAALLTRLFSLLGSTGIQPVQQGVYIPQAQQNVTSNLHTWFSKSPN